MVSLHRATQADAECLSNLLELYIHDVCDIFPSVELGDNGRFGYAKLPLYWAEPERRFAFVIRHADRVAGFALATRGSPVATDPDTLDVAEFFVLRKYRRLGVGREAARLLWQALPGAWTVRVAERNQRALAFWSSAVAEFAAGTATEATLPGSPNTWRVFSFR
ncbi:MAG TPA: GNAT family N-acetyltransferase [Polyangiaceae bacterium]|nr:GNAT family N-acetyltransferase [Polyangiaceae bacterium]